MPSPVKAVSSTMMTFPEAMQAVLDGKRITKLEWQVQERSEEYYCALVGGYLSLHKPDGKWYNWNINDGDMLGTDWVVIE